MHSGRRRRFAVVGAAVVATAALLTGAAAMGVRATDVASAATDLAGARAALAAALDDLGTDLEHAADTADEGRDLVEASAGRTLDDTARTTLATELDALDTAAVDADAGGDDARAELDDPDHAGATPGLAATDGGANGTVDGVANALAVFAASAPAFLGDPGSLRRSADRLAGASDAVDDLATALRDHIAHTADAADAVRAAIGERDAWLAGIRASAYHETVWAAGWTPELDACRGSVDLSAAYGLPAIAEHWSCTGKEFPREPGSYVVFDGIMSGTYRVDGVAVVLDQDRHTTADLPRGHDLLYQTCLGGNSSTMALVALTRID